MRCVVRNALENLAAKLGFSERNAARWFSPSMKRCHIIRYAYSETRTAHRGLLPQD